MERIKVHFLGGPFGFLQLPVCNTRQMLPDFSQIATSEMDFH